MQQKADKMASMRARTEKQTDIHCTTDSLVWSMLCISEANCTNTADNFTCTCLPGYHGNGFTCTDVDECASNNGSCDVNAHCNNSPGSFTCTCNQYYIGDGFTCESFCPSVGGGDFEYDDATTSCLAVFTNSLTWSDAGPECHTLDSRAHLVVIHSADKQTVVAKFLQVYTAGKLNRSELHTQLSSVQFRCGASNSTVDNTTETGDRGSIVSTTKRRIQTELDVKFSLDGKGLNCPKNRHYGRRFWTAGQRVDPNRESKFVWKLLYSNGTVVERALTYAAWFGTQPNFSGSPPQSCMEVVKDRNYHWSDAPCDVVACSICEIDP